jgi:hypothetical protein
VRDRQPELRRVFTGQRDDLCELLGPELARRTAALSVRQHVDDERLELLVTRVFAPLRVREARTLVVPAVSPTQDPLRVNPERRRLFDRWFAGR